MSIEELSAKYGIDGQLAFVAGKGDSPWIEINNGLAQAVISVYAGQVLSYRPVHATEDMLFMGGKACFEAGKAIKGGIPVCWPWFGPDPLARGGPAHGFVRNRLWSVIATEVTTDGATRVILGVSETEETRALWPHRFDLNIEITVGDRLAVELVTRNTGDQAFTVTQALHTYFRIGDISRVKVFGLEDADYLDKAGNGERKSQTGAVAVAEQVDRIYLDVRPELVIDDVVLGRRIRISTAGNRTAVVWNPWAQIASEMADLADDDYRYFICVETTNAAEDVVQVPAAGEYRLSAAYSVERGSQYS